MSKSLTSLAALGVIAGGLVPTTASAQERVIEEIVVTATKREQALVDVPFSVAAVTADDLRNQNAVTMEDIARSVAGFTVQSLGPGQSQVAIRGLSGGQIVRDQPGVKEQVGVYLDESVLSLSLFTPELDLYDLNRVEVLRGPQGTLYGAGSTSGTVRYISNQPDPEAFDATVEVTGQTVDDGSEGGNVRGMVNVPIADNAAVRVVGYYRKEPGWTDAIGPGGRTENDVNEGDVWGTRVSLLWDVTDQLTVKPRVIYQDMEIDGFNRSDEFNILGNEFTTTRPAVSLDDREIYAQFKEEFSDEFLLVDLELEYDFGSMALTSVTSYTDRDILQVRDATQLTASITGGSIGLPEDIYTIDAPLDDATDVEVFTQELRLASTGEDRLQWVIGGFYSDIDRDYGQSLFVDGFEDASGIPTTGVRAGKDILFYSEVPYDIEQFAIFGEVTYAVTDRLDITVGGRYYDFEEDRVQVFDGLFGLGNDDVLGQDIVRNPGDTDSDGFSPRVIAAYALTDDVNIYGQAAKGFRLGGINDSLNETLCTDADLATFGGFGTWDDEQLWNYELGMKADLWGGRGSLNVAVFYMDIEDLQATLTAGSCSSRIIFSIPDAESTGVEVEFSAQVTDFLDFAVSASYINAEIDSTVTGVDADGNPIDLGVRKGRSLPTAPEWQFASSLTYERPLPWAAWSGYVSTTFQYFDERYTQVGDQAVTFGTVPLFTNVGDTTVDEISFDPELGSQTNLNLRIGMRNDRYDVALWATNLTDDDTDLALDQERGGSARVGRLTNKPRTFGLTAAFQL